MDAFLAAKIVITVAVVSGLSLIAEYGSARLSGLLAGFPHGVAIVLLFIGLEQGVDFAAMAATHTLAGLAANAAFAWGYWKALHILPQGGWPLAPLLALGMFFLCAAAFSRLPLDVFAAAALAFAAIAVTGWQTRREAEVRIGRRLRLGLHEVALRAAVAAATVVAITSAARAIGPAWAGLLAGFPVVTFPFLLIIHAGHGAAPLLTILRAYPSGLASLAVFALTVSFAFPALGLGWGTAAGFAAAAAWLGLYRAFSRLAT